MSDLRSYVVRPMRRSETSFVKALLKEDGGEHGTKEELDTWRAVDGEGFFVAVFEGSSDGEGGKIVGCCAAFILGDNYGHIGMALPPLGPHTIILPQLMSAAVKRLGARKITFNCRAEYQTNYQNLGFVNVASYKWLSCSLKCPKDLKVFRATHVYRSMSLTEQTMIERVLDYDATIHSYNNREILRHTIAEPGCLTRVFVGNKEVSGYACLRRLFTGGWRISPIVCEDGGGALCLVTDLLMALTSAQLEQGVTFFIPDDNDVAVDLAKTMGFSISDSHVRVTLSNQPIAGGTPNWLYSMHSPTFSLF